MNKKIKTALVLSDLHIPYHDVAALNIACKAIKQSKPTYIILLGDIADFYGVSSHDKDPNRKESFQDEIDATVEFLTYVKKLSPKSKIIFLEGNHEYRMQRWLWKRGTEVSSLRSLKIDELLQLKKLGIEYWEYNHPMKIGNLVFIHGQYMRGKSGQSALSALDGYGSVSYIQGHIHRAAQVYKTDWNGVNTGIENPCLCRIEQDYIGKKVVNWQQGFTFVEWFGDHDMFHATQHLILRTSQDNDLHCRFRGTTFTERDYDYGNHDRPSVDEI